MGLEIVRWPNAMLTHPCRGVTPAELEEQRTQDLIEEMLRLVSDHRNHGWVGLAANQVGFDINVFVGFLAEGRLEAVINPLIRVNRSGGYIISREGCVSMSRLQVPLLRANSLTLSFLDRDGQAKEVDMRGYYATIPQHETDHLSGKSILDVARYKVPIARHA